MSFWTTEALASTGTVETGGGSIEPIPAKTQVKAAIDEAKWDIYGVDQYISLRWTVLAPADYKNRKIFQKIKVNDPAKSEPTDSDLQKHLLNKPMALLLQVWKIKPEDGSDEMTGNWISSVSPLKSKVAPTPPPAVEIDDDDIGF